MHFGAARSRLEDRFHALRLAFARRAAAAELGTTLDRRAAEQALAAVATELGRAALDLSTELCRRVQAEEAPS